MRRRAGWPFVPKSTRRPFRYWKPKTWSRPRIHNSRNIARAKKAMSSSATPAEKRTAGARTSRSRRRNASAAKRRTIANLEFRFKELRIREVNLRFRLGRGFVALAADDRLGFTANDRPGDLHTSDVAAARDVIHDI